MIISKENEVFFFLLYQEIKGIKQINIIIQLAWAHVFVFFPYMCKSSMIKTYLAPKVKKLQGKQPNMLLHEEI